VVDFKNSGGSPRLEIDNPLFKGAGNGMIEIRYNACGSERRMGCWFNGKFELIRDHEMENIR